MLWEEPCALSRLSPLRVCLGLAGCDRVEVLLASQVEADGEVGVRIRIPVEFGPASTFSHC